MNRLKCRHFVPHDLASDCLILALHIQFPPTHWMVRPMYPRLWSTKIIKLALCLLLLFFIPAEGNDFNLCEWWGLWTISFFTGIGVRVTIVKPWCSYISFYENRSRKESWGESLPIVRWFDYEITLMSKHSVFEEEATTRLNRDVSMFFAFYQIRKWREREQSQEKQIYLLLRERFWAGWLSFSYSAWPLQYFGRLFLWCWIELSFLSSQLSWWVHQCGMQDHRQLHLSWWRLFSLSRRRSTCFISRVSYLSKNIDNSWLENLATYRRLVRCPHVDETS